MACGGAFVWVVDERGRVWLKVESYRTVDLPAAVSQELAMPFRVALSA